MLSRKSEIILFYVELFLAIACLTLMITILSIKPKKLLENKSDDIIIESFSSINFIDIESFEYLEPNSNLGLTGRLILDCYSGKCTKNEYYYDSENNLMKNSFDVIEYSCSKQCSYNGKNNCICNIPYNEVGSCSRIYDDNYNPDKFCYGNNVIYFWKGKRYISLKTEVYTYYKNAKLKDEECPEGTKFCGIIDDNENKLCVLSNSNCPINYFSEYKRDENKHYSSITIDNKIFYYTFDKEISKNQKIIAGLVADTDLYLNENNDEKVLIDTYTISGFLEDNKNLYKEVSLGFDPYQEVDIDKKGKSYLRLYYNNKVDLNYLRKKIDQYNLNVRMNSDLIQPINKKIKFIAGFGIPSSAFLLVLSCIIFCCLNSDIKCIIYIVIIYQSLILIALIFACININKLNKLKEFDPNNKEFNISKIINFVFIIFGFLSIIYHIFFILLIADELEKCMCLCDIFDKCSKKDTTPIQEKK